MEIGIESNFKNQNGAALVVALIMMIVFTLIGLASTFTSTFEMKLSGNKRGSTDAFYAADSGLQSTLSNVNNFSYTGISHDVSLNPNPTNAVVKVKLQLRPDGTPREDPPRGIGVSATHFEFSHHAVESVGQDQLESSLIRSNCTLEEKVLRLMPTLQGGTL